MLQLYVSQSLRVCITFVLVSSLLYLVQDHRNEIQKTSIISFTLVLVGFYPPFHYEALPVAHCAIQGFNTVIIP